MFNFLSSSTAVLSSVLQTSLIFWWTFSIFPDNRLKLYCHTQQIVLATNNCCCFKSVRIFGTVPFRSPGKLKFSLLGLNVGRLALSACNVWFMSNTSRLSDSTCSRRFCVRPSCIMIRLSNFSITFPSSSNETSCFWRLSSFSIRWLCKTIFWYNAASVRCNVSIVSILYSCGFGVNFWICRLGWYSASLASGDSLLRESWSHSLILSLNLLTLIVISKTLAVLPHVPKFQSYYQVHQLKMFKVSLRFIFVKYNNNYSRPHPSLFTLSTSFLKCHK